MTWLRHTMVVCTAGQLLLASGQTFNRRYDLFGQGYAQAAWDIERDGLDGYLIVSGTYYEDSLNIYVTVALSRTTSQGDVISEHKMIYGLNSIFGGWANSSIRTSDGGTLVGGGVTTTSLLDNAALLKFGPTGDSLWLREYGDGENDWIGRQVLACKDGGYLLCGETGSTGFVDAFLLRTDSSGNEVWRRTYGDTDYADSFMTVDTTMDEGYFAGGQFSVSASDKDLQVFRLNYDGDTLWSKRWGGTYKEPNAHLTTKGNGDPLVASAWGYAPDYLQMRLYMAELDAEDGSLVWEREYGPVIYGSTLLVGKEISLGAGHIAAGFTYDQAGAGKGVLLRTADNGDSLWMRTYFYIDSLLVDGMGQFQDVIPTVDGGFIACGVTQGCFTPPYPANYNQDVWVVKVDSLGCIIPGCDDLSTVITVQATNLKEALAVYPNPAHERTTVNVQLPIGSLFADDLRLRLVNSEGKEVLVRRAITGANELDVRSLRVGVYFVHLTSGTTWLSGAKLTVE